MAPAVRRPDLNHSAGRSPRCATRSAVVVLREHRLLLLGREATGQRGPTALAVPGQDVGGRHLQRSRGHACRPGTCRAALLRGPVRPDQREQRRRCTGRHLNDVDVGSGHAGAGPDSALPARERSAGTPRRKPSPRASGSAGILESRATRSPGSPADRRRLRTTARARHAASRSPYAGPIREGCRAGRR